MLHIQTIGRDDVGTAADEILGFRGGDFTDGGKTVRLPRRGNLHGIFRRDMLGAGLSLRRDMLHGGIDIHA